MGISVANLASETRSFTWKVLGEDVAVTYRPGVITYAWDNGAVEDALAATLVSLDVTNGKGKPIGLDATSLKEHIAIPHMRQLAKAIYRDANVDPTTAETSGGS